jgi:hypothetical protein
VLKTARPASSRRSGCTTPRPTARTATRRKHAWQHGNMLQRPCLRRVAVVACCASAWAALDEDRAVIAAGSRLPSIAGSNQNGAA